MMARRTGALINLTLAGLLWSGHGNSQVVRPSPQNPGIEEHLGVVTSMRDGVRLAADIFLPEGGRRWPAVLVRTPYNRKSPASLAYRYFVRRGYAVIIQDVRGRYASQGNFGQVSQEGPDANDTINWIAGQPWSNGRVVMAGSSYLGIVQWWAAIQRNPHLMAISPMCSGDDEYSDRFYSVGGAFKLGHRLLWFAENFNPSFRTRPEFGRYIGHLPLFTSDLAAVGLEIPFWRSVLSHPSYDDYWKRLSIRNQSSNLQIPILSLGGWFDNYAASDLDMFSRLVSAHKPVETWIGPWAHNPGQRFPTRDFGPEARLPIRAKQADWFDEWLKTPLSNHQENVEPALHLFVMGPDIWREEREWPLARTRYTPLYLSSNGHANTSSGDGALRWQTVPKQNPDSFVYDPANPVPTIGGALCCEATLLPPGPLSQAPVELRPDVLVYTSPVLTEKVEVTGPVRALLYVATSANDTDITAKLVDVEPDGQPLLVCDGLQRLRYRLSLTAPVFVKRNAIYQITVEAGVTSYVFEPGHRIRLEISSSNFPRFDRNMNTTAPNATQAKGQKARQTVYHEPAYPSAIILPVIPDTNLLRTNGARADRRHHRAGVNQKS